MFKLRPFRALRYQPHRVDVGTVLSRTRTNREPRRVALLTQLDPMADDGPGGAWRRARFRLAEWRRAGVLVRDAHPALYFIRQRSGAGIERHALFCALAAVPGALGSHVPDPEHTAALEGLRAVIDPVVLCVEDARVRRVLAHAAERDPDMTWVEGELHHDLWCLDDETTVARVVTQLELASPRVEDGAAGYEAHAQWVQSGYAEPPDMVPAGSSSAAGYALAFIDVGEERWGHVPVGAVIMPLTGALA